MGTSKVINSLCIFDELSVKAPFCQHSTYQMLKMVFHFRKVDTKLMHFASFPIRQPLFRYFDGFVLCINFLLLQSFKNNHTFLKWVFWNCVYTSKKAFRKILLLRGARFFVNDVVNSIKAFPLSFG